MTPNAGEIAHYLRASRALAKASACGCGCHAEEIADARSELEAIAFTTDDPALKLRCEAVLDGKTAVRELVREPFHDDVEQALPYEPFVVAGNHDRWDGCFRLLHVSDIHYS